MQTPRTLVHMLHDQAAQLGDRPALWSRGSGAFIPTSWRQYAARVKRAALGLQRVGLDRGDGVLLVGEGGEPWTVCYLAALASGAIASAVTSPGPAELEQRVRESRAVVVCTADPARLSELTALRSKIPTFKELVVLEPTGLPWAALSYADLLASGAGRDEGPYYDRVNALEPRAQAVLAWTPGTHGPAKPIRLSHQNLTWTAAQLVRTLKLSEADEATAPLPLAHAATALLSVHAPLVSGHQTYLGVNSHQVRPTVIFDVPARWEQLRLEIERRIDRLLPVRAGPLSWARRISSMVHARTLNLERVPVALELEYALARRASLLPFKAELGLDRARVMVSYGAHITRELLDFFASLDLVICDTYGPVEASGMIALNVPGATRFGTVGRPLSGVEVRIAEDGEIHVRGENVFLDAPADRSGWLATGDRGDLDVDGYLRLDGHKAFDPSQVEALLRRLAPLSGALVVGEGRAYRVALLTLDRQRVAALARTHAFPAEPRALVTHTPFLEHLNLRIEREVNANVPASMGIRRFVVLPDELTRIAGDLGDTLQPRRAACEKKYAKAIAALYERP